MIIKKNIGYFEKKCIFNEDLLPKTLNKINQNVD